MIDMKIFLRWPRKTGCRNEQRNIMLRIHNKCGVTSVIYHHYYVYVIVFGSQNMYFVRKNRGNPDDDF